MPTGPACAGFTQRQIALSRDPALPIQARRIARCAVDDKYHRLVGLSALAVAELERSVDVIHGFDQIESMLELVNLLAVRARGS